MQTETNGLTTGILDIYGFEIFQKNGFEVSNNNFVTLMTNVMTDEVY